MNSPHYLETPVSVLSTFCAARGGENRYEFEGVWGNESSPVNSDKPHICLRVPGEGTDMGKTTALQG